MLQCKNLCVNYSRKQVLSNINLEINNGLTCILGQNGAGKSTLIKALSNQITFSGSVFVNGVDVKSMSMKQRSQAFVFMSQSYEVAFNFTVAEILKMGFHNIKFNQKIYQKAIEMTHIIHLEERAYSTLSGGEKQRVQFARAIARLYASGAKVLILDEPSSSADIKQELNTIKLAKELSHQGNTIVMISHNISLALKYADSLIFLKTGILQKYAKDITQSDIAECFDVERDVVSTLNIVI